MADSHWTQPVFQAMAVRLNIEGTNKEVKSGILLIDQMISETAEPSSKTEANERGGGGP